MSMSLTITVPDGLDESFRSLADQEFRTPENQLLWLIRCAVRDAARSGEVQHFHAVPAHRSEEERRRDMQPMMMELRRLHVQAGAPSSRKMAERVRATGKSISHTTINVVMNGRNVPTWPILESIVLALNGDPEAVRPLWGQARDGTPERPSAAGSTPGG